MIETTSEDLSVAIQLAINDLSNRVRQLERVTGVADREIPIRCPWCVGRDSEVKVKSVAGWFVACCQGCGANGPNMLESKDAIWGWNQFVSHRGKVSSE